MLSSIIDIKKGTTIWLTGMSGAGKTTIAQEIKSQDAMEIYGSTTTTTIAFLFVYFY
jgi:adenylylsulfate kinase-like enzyme